jgi:hypothetical protein
MSRMDNWFDKPDHLNVERDDSIRELRSRLHSLEQRVSILEKPH